MKNPEPSVASGGHGGPDSGHSEESSAIRAAAHRRAMESQRAERAEAEVRRLSHALDRSVYLQAHYAKLLNMWDGGDRIVFENAQQWLDRLDALERTADTATRQVTTESPDPAQDPQVDRPDGVE
jgi:hypothetical protein